MPNVAICNCSVCCAQVPAIFQDFTAYKNGRDGAIASRIGDVRFVNFSVADNMRAGIEVGAERVHM
jgi:hypothetical protein